MIKFIIKQRRQRKRNLPLVTPLVEGTKSNSFFLTETRIIGIVCASGPLLPLLFILANLELQEKRNAKNQTGSVERRAFRSLCFWASRKDTIATVCTQKVRLDLIIPETEARRNKRKLRLLGYRRPTVVRQRFSAVLLPEMIH